MLKQEYSIGEAQAMLPELLDLMKPGEEVCLTKDGVIVAKLLRLPCNPIDKRRPPPGLGKGSILHMSDDFDSPQTKFGE